MASPNTHPKPRGAILPEPDSRDLRFSAEHYGAPDVAALPASVDLRNFVRIPDQKNKPICVGESSKILREVLHRAAPANYEAYAAVDIYRRANIITGSLAADDGADPRSAMQALLDQGICLESLCPPDTERDTDPPNDAQNANARLHRIKSYHACNTAIDVMQALATKSPVIVTIRAGTAFDADAEAGAYQLSAATLNDTTTPWNHEQVIAGYTGGASLTQGWWLCCGTWGTNLFNKGFFCVPKAMFDRYFAYPWTASLKAVQS